jgi:hypothetical protein
MERSGGLFQALIPYFGCAGKNMRPFAHFFKEIVLVRSRIPGNGEWNMSSLQSGAAGLENGEFSLISDSFGRLRGNTTCGKTS